MGAFPRPQQGGNVLKLVVNGPVASPLGATILSTLSSARGLQLAAVVDGNPEANGRDAGEVAGIPEPLELPVVADVIMVLASVAQSRSTGVYVDFTGDASAACENVRQATAFGLSSVVVGASIPEDDISGLYEFCDKASTGCIIAPTLSILSILLERAATQFAFHSSHAHIIESRADLAQAPSEDAVRLAQQLAQVGRTFNGIDASDDPARGLLMEEGVRVHSMQQPGLLQSTDVRLGSNGQMASLRLDITSHAAYMPGLLLAIRRAPRLKGLVFGLEKLL
ncbi:hypothetical protein CLOM_g18815 [Closterium sp. NIES-68]|nr:hypothetical protein CLOM_g11945 [Closterium sp. NIES-68]GJP34364.1 hypothetical protein CLOM_g18815 [Closterium sp. NIES-68]GJP64463.1 hypothetical protein CLOP_g21449 [Closterium sp. NIES-67]